MRRNSTVGNKGFTLLELIVVMVIITIIASQIIASLKGAADNGRIAAALNSVKAIQTAAMSYFNNNGGSCAGISVATLVAGNYLPGTFTGTNANPWGGNYTVAVNANNNTQFNLTMTNIAQVDATTLNNALQNSAQVVNYVAANSTWTGTF
jgi:prepilin-type N-terminal cleavage/methylation domain-containing protein